MNGNCEAAPMLTLRLDVLTASEARTGTGRIISSTGTKPPIPSAGLSAEKWLFGVTQSFLACRHLLS